MKNYKKRVVDDLLARLLKGATPRLIDEWQIAPKFWDAVRYHSKVQDGAYGHRQIRVSSS